MPRRKAICSDVESTRCAGCDDPCNGQPEITCYFKSTEAQKCGYLFTQSFDYKRFATATVSISANRLRTHDNDDPNPCPDTEQRVGVGGSPLTMVATSNPHIHIRGAGGSCTSGRACSVTSGNDAFADLEYLFPEPFPDPPTDPPPEPYSGGMQYCGFNFNLPLSPAVSPPGGGVGVNSRPEWPAYGYFFDASKDPPDQDFIVTTYDEELDPEDQPGWTLAANTSTHRTVTWDGNEDHDANGDCSTYVTAVTNSYDVQMSDEITDSELLAPITGVFNLPDVEVDEPQDGLCAACFAMNAVDARAIYSAAIVRFTNTSAFTLNITWKLHTSGASLGSLGSESDDCTPTSEPSPAELHSVCLEPGWTHDIELFPDIYSGGQAMWITDIVTVCSNDPCP